MSSSKVSIISDTILISTDGSSGVPLGGGDVLAIMLETGANTFTATTTYVLFKASLDDSTYDWVMSKNKVIWGVQVVATTNTTGWVYVPAEVFAGALYVSAHACSDSTGTGVTQGAARTIKYLCGKVTNAP
jgi:hypothetical protein